MQPNRTHSRRLAVVILALLVATGYGVTVLAAQPAMSRSTPTDATVDEPVGAPALRQAATPVALDPADFTTDIDNPYWPMTPGTRFIYREIDEEGTEQQIVVTVTAETKKIANGVTARVVRDTTTEDGELVEDTKDWYAQDQWGNIWYLGEDTTSSRTASSRREPARSKRA